MLVLLTLTACGLGSPSDAPASASPPSETNAAPSDAPSAAPGATPPVVPHRETPTLLLRGRTPDGRDLQLLPVDLRKSHAKLLEPLNTSVSRSTPVAFDGEHACFPAKRWENAHSVAYMTWYTPRLGVSSSARMAPPEGEERLVFFESSLVQGSRCWLGTTLASVYSADFTTKPSEAARLEAHPPEGLDPEKTVDVLANTGQELLAVDNMILPYYLIRFPWRGAAGEVGAGEFIPLGDGFNATYRGAYVLDDQLLLWVRSEHMGGRGQGLERASLAAMRHPSGEPLHTERWFGESQRALRKGEYAEDGSFDDWNGVEVIGERVFLCASAKGVLTARASDEAPERLDLHGRSCLGLAQTGGHLYVVLDDKGQRALEQLDWDEESHALASTPLLRLPPTVEGMVPLR